MYVRLLTNNFLSEKTVGKSESKDVHLAVLRVLPEVIRESVDADASSKSVIIYDPATGEKKMVSPTAVDGIESLGEVKTAEQTEAEINARMQDTIQRGKDWLEGNVANPVGMQIQLGDGRIATIEAMHEDGKSAIATLPDGTQFMVPKDVLQRIVNNGQYADYKARRDAEASKREAEQSTESAPETATEGGQPLPEEASPKEEESREYAQGDVFDVVVDGQKMHAEIVSPKDADGRFVVNVDDGESMRTLYVTPEELAAMEYREEPLTKAEETRIATEGSSEKALERGAQPTEEHTPTALERIPRDEKGNAQFHDVDTETAWDGLVEMSGNEETAHKVAEASLANAEKRLKAAKALKEKGETPEELLRSIKENEAAVAEAQRTVDAWKAIVGEKSRREEAAKAEAERIATEKAEAERKAAEKAEEEARVEDEKKAEEERKTKEEERKAKTDGDGQNGFNFFPGTIKELIAATRKKGSSLIKKVLSAASNRLIADLKDKGVDISPEYNHTIDNNAINHALNRHSSDKEKEQGQIPLTEKDIENVNDVIDNYDEIKTEKNSRGQDIIIYKKRYTDGTTLYVEEVRTGRKELAMASMRKQRSRKLTDADDQKSTPSSDLPSASADKGSEKPGKKQEKQSVFDKAKEIADKEEKKRKAEADKPKQKPLTEAERKDAEKVAGALGYRVEWVDTMEENGTIDADKKVIRIAKDAENPLVQVLGHEVAHGVKRMDGGKFKALQKAALEVVGEKEWDERIEKKRKLNAYAEGKLAEEVTCDIVGEALNNKDALKRLAESLRGEKGILARLRDAVARMVEYFKNRGDKEGVRRMKAADKLLAEFESALKEDVASGQANPEGVDRSVRESRSEKTELTEEERELRDNLVERMRKGGLDVVTDSEEMQRVIDRLNGRGRLSGRQKSALETATIAAEATNNATVISSADGAKIQNNLGTLATNYENIANKTRGFITDLSRALGLKQHGASQYGTFEAPDGKRITIRVSNHNARVSNFDKNNESEGISIVISSHKNKGLHNDGNAHIIEYFYPKRALENAEGKPLAEMIRSVSDVLAGGEFKDTTGLAEREEVNAGSVREHRVYHGSGANFDAFDHSHMGEGEGAQAYGWGTYVTEVEGIGRTYAEQNATTHNDALRALQHDVDAISDQLSRHRDDLKYDEEQLKRANEWRAEAELDYELFRDEAEKLKEKYGEDSPEYRNHLFNDIYTDEMKRAQSSVKSTEESIQYRKEKIAELEKALKDKQAEIDELPKEFPRHLYTVEIPDDNGSNYLDWNGHPAESLLKDVGSFLESNGFERVQDSPVRYEKGESTVVLNPNATGADLYAELREALGSDKKASQALSELGCIGIKYPADNMRGGRKDGAKNYVIFNENDAKITDHIRFLRTAGGEVYGLVKDGRIYLDPKVATAETAVHEYTHLWGDMLRRKDSEQWSHTVKELKDSVLWEEVKELYPELKTDDEIADEVLSTFSGRRGAERLREEARRVADGESGVFTKAKAIDTLERVKETIARFWEGVARMFGINRYRSAEELADMAMKDLLDSKNPMKDESGMRKRGEVGDEGVKSLKGEEAMVALDNIFEDKKTENMPQKVSSLVKFMELFRKPVRTFLGEVVNVKEEVYNKIIREKRTSISGAVLPTLENADFAIRDTDGSTLYIKRFKSENNDNVYNIAVVNKYGEVEDYVSSVHIKSDNNLRNKITKGAELLLPQERITDGILPRNNPTPTANVTNISEPSKPRYSRKPGESIFDYASRVSEDVDRSVRERVSARDEYEKKVKSKGFQTKEALQNSMLGLQEFMLAIDHASGNKRYIEDIPDFENPILGENRLSSVNKEEMHQVAKTQFKPLMSAVAKLSGNGKESGELYDYMFAKHGLERDAVMRQREAQKEFDKYQKANPKGTKTIGDFVASLEGKDYAGLTALTAEDGRVKSIQSQIDAIDEQMKATDDQLLLHYLGGQKKRLKVDLLNAARDAADDIRKAFESNPSHDRSDINELWSRVNEVNGNTLRKLYESGMLTKEAYNDISSMYTNYIPMRGFDQTTSADAYAYLTHGDSAFNAPIKTAKGRSSKADNPIAYMQAMAESAIMQGNRNVLVKQKMLNFVRNHPSDLASVSDVWLQYDSVADEWKPFYAFGRESKG